MEGGEESAVADFLQILEEHRKNCERQGKYVEAEIAKNRLEELKLHEENRRKEAMRSRQIAERLGVEEAHMPEFQQFNMVWDKKMSEYENHAEMLVESLKVRHTKDLKDFQRKLLQKQVSGDMIGFGLGLGWVGFGLGLGWVGLGMNCGR